ncbi:MAG: DUF1512 domain-containing protein [Sulfolobales archaeon]
MDAGSSSDTWYLILLLMFALSFILNFTDIPQRIQLWRFASYIRRRLVQMDEIESDVRRRLINYLGKLNISTPKEVVDNFINNYFLIEPVDIEPIDIIKRLSHLINVRDANIKSYAERYMLGVQKHEKYNAIVALEIASAINTVNKILKHYFKLGLKNNNWVLLMQLALEMPNIIRIVNSYSKALDAFFSGTPIGDGAGPLLIRYLVGNAEGKQLAEDTVYYETVINGRKVYAIKAEGPGATVGKPGEALEKLVEMLGGNVARIITVDAALKLEIEDSGEVAEGVGAAIGDVGPEKIGIERAAAKYGIPLDAVVIKMSLEEAINTMTKEVYEGVLKAFERVKNIINRVSEGSSVIVVGVGNTVGVL